MTKTILIITIIKKKVVGSNSIKLINVQYKIVSWTEVTNSKFLVGLRTCLVRKLEELSDLLLIWLSRSYCHI